MAEIIEVDSRHEYTSTVFNKRGDNKTGTTGSKPFQKDDMESSTYHIQENQPMAQVDPRMSKTYNGVD